LRGNTERESEGQGWIRSITRCSSPSFTLPFYHFCIPAFLPAIHPRTYLLSVAASIRLAVGEMKRRRELKIRGARAREMQVCADRERVHESGLGYRCLAASTSGGPSPSRSPRTHARTFKHVRACVHAFLHVDARTF
jgi:hypothetical protein